MTKLLSFFTRGRVYFLQTGPLLLFALFLVIHFFGGAAPEAAPASAESCQPATHEAVPFAWMRHDVPLLVRYSPIFFLLIVGNLALKQMYLLWRGCTGRQRRSAWLLLLSFAVAGVGFSLPRVRSACCRRVLRLRHRRSVSPHLSHFLFSVDFLEFL